MPHPLSNKPIRGSMDELYRQSYGRIIAALVSRFGVENFELAEDSAQEALAKAAIRWPVSGVPDEPASWLIVAARNHAIDVLRRNSRWNGDLTAAELDRRLDPVAAAESVFEAELSDDELKMMFYCCDPALAPAARVILTLDVVCGFQADAIARPFFLQKDAVYQRIRRAKEMLRKSLAPFALPRPVELPGRLNSVLDAIYLMFNEGYSCRNESSFFQVELTDEAIRLAGLLCRHSISNQPHVYALHALMLLQSSRLGARMNEDEVLIPLSRQDRKTWDRDRIASGLAALERASSGPVASQYHVFAGIAACHAVAESYERTDWDRIIALYNGLTEVKEGFVVELNRAVAIAERDGPEHGLRELRAIHDPRCETYYLFSAAEADMLSANGNAEEAERAFHRAAELSPTEAERRYFEARASEDA